MLIWSVGKHLIISRSVHLVCYCYFPQKAFDNLFAGCICRSMSPALKRLRSDSGTLTSSSRSTCGAQSNQLISTSLPTWDITNRSSEQLILALMQLHCHGLCSSHGCGWISASLAHPCKSKCPLIFGSIGIFCSLNLEILHSLYFFSTNNNLYHQWTTKLVDEHKKIISPDTAGKYFVPAVSFIWGGAAINS